MVKSMAAKLSQVERLNQIQAAKLARQSQEIDQLRAEVRILQESAASPTASDSASDDSGVGEADTGGAGGRSSASLAKQVRALRAERDHFKKEVEDMTKFLEDYGLTWVGEDESDDTEEGGGAEDGGAKKPAAEVVQDSAGGTGDSGATAASSPSSPSAKSGRQRTPMTWNVDIEQMKERVDSLNGSVEKAGARVVSDRVGGAVHARLVTDDALPLPLTFFQDGVKLGDCAFHDFRQPQAQQLLRDILDGYFPYILKDRYPDGVLLRVMDRMAHSFEDWLRDHASGDPDLADNGDRLLPALGRAIRAPGSSAGAWMRGQGGELAWRTPEKVVRGGKICEGPGLATGRGSLAGSAGHRGNSAPVGDRAPQSEVSMLEAGRDPTAPAVHLQVKLESGQRVVLRMEPIHTIGALEDALDQWRTGQGEPAADAANTVRPRLTLQSAFPRRSYTDRAQTLADAGLAPSATLFVTSVAPNS